MKKKHRFLKVLSIILFVIIGIGILHFLATNIVILSLRAYIRSFDEVKYDNQLVPEIGEEGYYTFTTDDDFRIMQISDMHLGGGYFSIKQDRKTVYEIMTMVQKEKPDLVILNGDQTFGVPGPLFNGGGTFNNKMISRQINYIFKTLGVYYTSSFGNHDTESFDFYNREQLGEVYSKADHSIFRTDYDGYGVSNQCILVKGTDGSIRKAIMLIDSNAYVDESLQASINWLYDYIHDDQVEWAKNTIEKLSQQEGHLVKSIFFFHIPIGEFESAYRELEANDFNDTANTKYIEGVWNELVDSEMGGRIWYGGCQYTDRDPNSIDKLFEELGPDGINSMEACFVAHDHVNDAVVLYKGVMLAYGSSIDNLAYSGIAEYGLQRGSMIVTIGEGNEVSQVHKNAYLDYGCDANKFYEVNLKDRYYEDYAPKK